MKFAGIFEMLGISHCKTVGSVKSRVCAEIDILVSVRIEDSINAGFWRHIDRCRRKACVFVRIVW